MHKFHFDLLLILFFQILDFSKIEAGKLDVEHLVFDLKRHLGDLSQALAIKANDKGLEFILDDTQIPERSCPLELICL